MVYFKSLVKADTESCIKSLKYAYGISANSFTDINLEEYKTALSDSALIVTYTANTSTGTYKCMEIYMNKGKILYTHDAVDFGNADLLKDIENIFNSMK